VAPTPPIDPSMAGSSSHYECDLPAADSELHGSAWWVHTDTDGNRWVWWNTDDGGVVRIGRFDSSQPVPQSEDALFISACLRGDHGRKHQAAACRVLDIYPAIRSTDATRTIRGLARATSGW
jgi:hypothetical protein